MKQVNLEEILHKFTLFDCVDSCAKLNIILAMQEACNQTVDLCAENAEVVCIQVEYIGERAGGYYTTYDVDKESILNTKKQII